MLRPPVPIGRGERAREPTMLPVSVCLVAVFALLVAERAGWTAGVAIAKLTASSAFVWAAHAWGASATAYGQLLLLGLVLCWLGDALLLAAGRSIWFQLGIGAFLLAHVAYAFACTRLPLQPLVLVVSGALVAVLAWRVLRWLRPHVPGSFRWPVVSYVVVISAMVALAVAAVGGGAPLALGVGAVGFAVSDVSVARERFVHSGFVNPAWGLPTYFLSQLALAYSASEIGSGV